MDRASDFLRPGGALSERTPGFEHREGQTGMADLVEDILETGGALMVEAGTGIGKSYAYLLPVLLRESKERVVISTATKNLQDQLFEKDLPALQRALGSRVPAARIKGRGNYLCKRAWQEFEPSPALLEDRKRDVEAFARWAARTKTGDRDELGGKGLAAQDVFGRLAASSENCIGRDCDLYDDCHLTRVREEAEAARIVIVNHHLLIADRVVRDRQNDYGSVLPDYGVVIVDEAHRLETAATSSLSVELTSATAERLATEVRSFLRQAKAPVPGELKAFQDAWRSFFDRLKPKDGEPRILDPRRLEPKTCLGFLGDVQKAVRKQEQAEESAVAEAAERVSMRIGDVAAALEAICETRENRVVWSAFWRDRNDDRKPVLGLRSAPVHPGGELRGLLFSDLRAAVLTSATLAVEGDFSFAAGQLGVDQPTTKVFGSPFDYRNHARLYVARDMPDPRQSGFAEAAAETISRLVAASRGRALVLCTSWRNLEAVGDRLEARCSWPLLRQRPGEGHGGLLKQFRRTPGAVLLGVRAFWEGVDLPGAALSLLVIDRLPFTPPSDPLHRARAERAERETGRSGFFSHSVPEAALTLKQGLGRLIRSGTDQGLAAVLDPRLVTMRYGEALRKSLPDFTLTTDREKAVAFLESLP